jgi:ATP-binding cassette subfamily A (ABC1) protein 3
MRIIKEHCAQIGGNIDSRSGLDRVRNFDSEYHHFYVIFFLISNQMTMLGTYVLLIVDSLLYYAFARYMDKVKPGKWGVAQKWYFLCQPSYWCQKSRTADNDADYAKTELTEPVPQGLKNGFQLTNVIKEFTGGDGTFKAVDDLSFVALESQITVLLGHNGAGKSTTMNMLSGMLEPDQGNCYVNEIDVTTNSSLARQNLGLCPQHNILITEMTVKERV